MILFPAEKTINKKKISHSKDGSNYSSSTSSMSIAPYNTNVETSMKKFNPQQHSTGPMSSQTSSMIMDGQQNFQPIIDQSSSNHTLNNMNQTIIDQRQQTINQTFIY
ncbi:hypothetical protein QR98_0005250 [Sarcoptes scabiei]|uniref:Uncharacterized protein n=1 Tax=Sarcoptes scabiei TaxID=52283 RepID=A0A131ZUA4_SARSC|nr:hypothetical protein QR98_0005250 [Sarcoptes scabiei]